METPGYRKALIPIIKTLSCYEQGEGEERPGGWAAAAAGVGGTARGREGSAERKEKSFNLALSTPPAPNSQLLSDAISVSPGAHALLTTAAARGGGVGGGRGPPVTKGRPDQATPAANCSRSPILPWPDPSHRPPGWGTHALGLCSKGLQNRGASHIPCPKIQTPTVSEPPTPCPTFSPMRGVKGNRDAAKRGN